MNLEGGGDGELMGKSGGRGNCGWDARHERIKTDACRGLLVTEGHKGSGTIVPIFQMKKKGALEFEWLVSNSIKIINMSPQNQGKFQDSQGYQERHYFGKKKKKREGEGERIIVVI